jgi:hypothetical protein
LRRRRRSERMRMEAYVEAILALPSMEIDNMIRVSVI